MTNDSKLIFEKYTRKKSTEDLFTYLKSIEPLITEARETAIDSCSDPAEKASLSRGHGIYVGNCGHVIKRCRCMRKHEPIIVNAACPDCV